MNEGEITPTELSGLKQLIGQNTLFSERDKIDIIAETLSLPKIRDNVYTANLVALSALIFTLIVFVSGIKEPNRYTNLHYSLPALDRELLAYKITTLSDAKDTNHSDASMDNFRIAISSTLASTLDIEDNLSISYDKRVQLAAFRIVDLFPEMDVVRSEKLTSHIFEIISKQVQPQSEVKVHRQKSVVTLGEDFAAYFGLSTHEALTFFGGLTLIIVCGVVILVWEIRQPTLDAFEGLKKKAAVDVLRAVRKNSENSELETWKNKEDQTRKDVASILNRSRSILHLWFYSFFLPENSSGFWDRFFETLIYLKEWENSRQSNGTYSADSSG